MKIIFPVIALLLLCGPTKAQESSNYVSSTFQDILSRVVKRDKASGAILIVKPKSDVANPGITLRLSITPGRKADETVIILECNNMLNDGIYEKYRLRTDTAMREEIKRQALYQHNWDEQAKKQEEQLARKIEEKTSGAPLHYGMTVAEVKEIKGEPVSIERVPTQQFVWTDELNKFKGYINLIYPDMILYFVNNNLHRLTDIPKTGITDITLEKGTGSKTLTPEKFKELLQTAVPMFHTEYAQHSIPGGYWYQGSFRTRDGFYSFSLGLGGVNILHTPGGMGMYFKFTEK